MPVVVAQSPSVRASWCSQVLGDGVPPGPIRSVSCWGGGCQAGVRLFTPAPLKDKPMARSPLNATRAAVIALILFSSGTAPAQQDAVTPSGTRTAGGLLARQGEGSFRPVTFEPGKSPFALRNNNWVAIKGPNIIRFPYRGYG